MRRLWVAIFLVLVCGIARAQGNYEIQVYGADTVAPKDLMVELHSNFTVSGQTQVIDGVRPTNHQERETLELTAGINDWAEVGFYVFSAAQSGYGWQWVGDHIRPRVRAPDKWHLPVGLSLSTEVGYQRPEYSPDTWTWEIRPIVDKTDGAVVFRVQSGAGADAAWAGCESGAGVLAGGEGELRLYEEDQRGV